MQDIVLFNLNRVRSLIGSFFSTVATRGSGETPRLKRPPGKLWFMKMFMCYFSQSEQVLDGMFGFQRKNGVVWRNIGTCSSTFRYQQVKDGASVDLRRPNGIQWSNWHNLRNTKPRNGTDNMINQNKVHQEVSSSYVSLDRNIRSGLRIWF